MYFAHPPPMRPQHTLCRSKESQGPERKWVLRATAGTSLRAQALQRGSRARCLQISQLKLCLESPPSGLRADAACLHLAVQPKPFSSSASMDLGSGFCEKCGFYATKAATSTQRSSRSPSRQTFSRTMGARQHLLVQVFGFAPKPMTLNNRTSR